MTIELILPFLLFFVIATLYSSVGHAGASGYLAIMALLDFVPEAIKPTSLVLNIIVAAIASFKFIRHDCFDKRIFFSFVLSSLPFAFLGGYLSISNHYFKLLAGVFLLLSAVLLLAKEYLRKTEKQVRVMPLHLSLGIGSVIGFLSGLIGVGGGIFLSPILILGNWATAKKTAGISALFILCNSVSGLVGHISSLHHTDGRIVYWAAAVITGGLLGSYLGAKRFSSKIIISFLFVVLLSAGIKFILAVA
jgi:uncharacterized protein